jgi:tetratricopeptide (TPR) repeat protein
VIPMHCPICNEIVRPADRECACGEPLTAWRNWEYYGNIVRQRGLQLAKEGDFLGAFKTFMVAALGNPLDSESLLDAARALFRLGRPNDALDLLRGVQPNARSSADDVAQAIKEATALQPPIETKAVDAALELEEMGRSLKRESLQSGSVPLLALPPLRRRSFKAWLGKRQAVRVLWENVLQLEAAAPVEGSSALRWLASLDGDSSIQTISYYASGLVLWEEDEVANAGKRFLACMECNPPFLNPAAYYLVAQGSDRVASCRAWDVLKETCSTRELQGIWEALQRLSDGESTRLEPKTLARLRTACSSTAESDDSESAPAPDNKAVTDQAADSASTSADGRRTGLGWPSAEAAAAVSPDPAAANEVPDQAR